MAEDNYYGVDPDACYFFRNGWEERIKAAAQPAYEAYLKRNNLHADNQPDTLNAKPLCI